MVDKDWSQAKTLLADAGLRTETTFAPSDRPENTVLDQTHAGDKVAVGTVITLTVAQPVPPTQTPTPTLTPTPAPSETPTPTPTQTPSTTPTGTPSATPTSTPTTSRVPPRPRRSDGAPPPGPLVLRVRDASLEPFTAYAGRAPLRLAGGEASGRATGPGGDLMLGTFGVDGADQHPAVRVQGRGGRFRALSPASTHGQIQLPTVRTGRPGTAPAR